MHSATFYAGTVKHTRGDSLMLAGVGTLAVHEIAYVPGSVWASVAGDGVSHSHLPLLWGVGGSVAVAALIRFVVASLRSRGGSRRVDPVWLGLAMGAFFISQEAAERALSGSPAISLVTEWVLWLGLLAVPLVAVLLARLVTCLAEAVAGAASVSPRRTHGRVPVLRSPVAPGRATHHVALAHVMVRRGPPVRTVF